MMRKSLVALSLLASMATPALAGASHWYINLDPTTKKCSVMQTKADGKTMMAASKKSFKSEASATTAMTGMKECK